jgi:hypothetical protein
MVTSQPSSDEKREREGEPARGFFLNFNVRDLRSSSFSSLSRKLYTTPIVLQRTFPSSSSDLAIMTISQGHVSPNFGPFPFASLS